MEKATSRTGSGGGPPLDGVTVVELGGPLIWYAGRLLALLGADVSRVELPAELAACLAPWPSAGNAYRAARLYNHAGKRLLELDPREAAQRAQLDGLLRDADVLLVALPPRDLQLLGLAPQTLAERYPWLVVTAATAFGLTGPYRDYESTDLIGLASGGQLYLTGYPDRRPLQYGGYQAYKQAATHAAYGTLLALLARQHTGRGQVVDVSMQECIANSLQTTMQQFDLRGEVRRRVGSRLLRCKDGYVRSMAIARGRAAMLDWLEDEGFGTELRHIELSPSGSIDPQTAAAIDAVLESFCLTKSKAELLEGALARGIALAPVHTAEDVLALPALAQRDYWAELASGAGLRTVRAPAAPFRLSDGAAVRRLQAATAEGFPGAAAADRPAARERAAVTADRQPPLAGITVLDFTWYGAGSMATRVLAHFGATVIKVESAGRIDGIRLAPPFRAEPGINLSGFFNNFNTGKLSLSLDLNRPEARAVAERLVRRADVVADNFSPGALGRFGLDDAKLRDLNPRLVVLHMPMGGLSGPLSRAVGFGATIEAISGLVHLMGDPDRAPVGTEVNFPDYGPNPYQAVTAVLAGLFGRAASGQGCLVELSQIESTIAFVGESLMQAQFDGAVAGRAGNRSAEAVLSEVLPCRGDDAWCAVACRSWVELGRLLELAGIDAQQREPATLVEELSAWSRGKDKYRLAEVLQARRIPAYPATTSEDLVTRDPQLAARGHYVVMEHPQAGAIRHDGPPIRLAATPGDVNRPAPCLGQHTEEVLHNVLGMSRADIEALAATGALV